MSKTDKIEKEDDSDVSDVLFPIPPVYDEFLITMTKIFQWLRWLGVVGRERFVWKTWASMLLAASIVIEMLAVRNFIVELIGGATDTAGNRSVKSHLAAVIFYSGSLAELVLCWRLASSWRSLCKYWVKVEMALSLKHVPLDTKIPKRMYTAAIAVLLCSILVYITSVITLSGFEETIYLFLRKYILKSNAFLLQEHEYRDWMLIPLLLMSIISILIRNVQDLLIILISMGLSSRYRRLNQCVATISRMSYDERGWYKNVEFQTSPIWRRLREGFVKQSMLVKRVDGHLGGLILASCFYNFYGICLQLYIGISRGISGGLINEVSYVISFSWLCFRTAFAILSAADVNRSSKMALPFLYQCQPAVYNVEIERLQKQLNKQHIALSGMGLFYLTRTNLLQMSAAVLTYALVLMQYEDKISL